MLRTTVKDISSLGKPRERILETESTFSFTKIKCLEIILYVSLPLLDLKYYDSEN